MGKKMASKKVFREVTNEDIYKTQVTHRALLQDIKEHLIKTNGKVKLNSWKSNFALSLVIGLAGLIIGKVI
jgi:hypothetical protein